MDAQQQQGRRSRLLATGCLISLLSMSIPAAANFDTNEYTLENCRKRVDPINFVFYGPGAWWDTAAIHVENHTDWGTPRSLGPQQNFVHGTCYDRGTERASDAFNQDRHHIRFFYAHESTTYGYAVGDAHWEEIVFCGPHFGHAVPANSSVQGSGFNRSRKQLRTAMSDYHTVHRVWWGNTARMKQCNEQYAGSDGWTTWAYIA